MDENAVRAALIVAMCYRLITWERAKKLLEYLQNDLDHAARFLNGVLEHYGVLLVLAEVNG